MLADKRPSEFVQFLLLAHVDDRVASIASCVSEIDAIVKSEVIVAAGISAEATAALESLRGSLGALALHLPKPTSRTVEPMDAELRPVLLRISSELARLEACHGTERDALLSGVEAIAAPYALAFYHEMLRLDALMRSRHLADQPPASSG